jgi:hypothetical protein
VNSIPGTFAAGFTEPALIPISVQHAKRPGVRGLVAWRMGECWVTRFRDAGGLHLTVSHDSRCPSWDEIKTARYRCLPHEETWALLLPPPAEYVDHPLRPYVFELTRVQPGDTR